MRYFRYLRFDSFVPLTSFTSSTSLTSFTSLALIFGVVLLAAGCGGAGGASGSSSEGSTSSETSAGASADGETLTVFAAASLTDAFGELGDDFEDRTGARVRFNFAGSSTLAAQIQQGAPADVYASANEDQMQNVSDDDLLAGEPETFVRNREVVVVPKGNPGGIEDFSDLSGPGLKLVLAAEEVPAAEYAEDILDNAAKDDEYGPQFRKAALGNIVSREEDVRAAVNRVVVGDADGTFGYSSDVTPDVRDEVKVIQIPQNLNVIATYPIAVLKDGEDKDLSRQWVDFVNGDRGQKVLEKWGFEPADK